MRIHILQSRMSFEQADILQYYLDAKEQVINAKIQERTADVTVSYQGSREGILSVLEAFTYERAQVPEVYLKNSGRQMNREYWDRLVNKTVIYFGNKIFLPYPIRAGITMITSVKYIWKGLTTLARRRIEVPVLDATAIGVSIFRGDISTASSVMFLLSLGEILEEWTHKKSVGDLARSMSLNISKVWLVRDGQEIMVPVTEIRSGDPVRVHMGNVIPFDGCVIEGEAMVNQASLTGESVPVRRAEGSTVYAGTVVEEGEITFKVKEANGSSKYEKIMAMIEESEKLKSSLESKAEHLADRLVPYTFLGTGLVWLLTRNMTKTISVLMVDFSCALKLAMPLSVLSAIREASTHDITVKGGKYLEAMADATTIVFDKTGTLTKAQPTVVEVISFNEKLPDELLRIAACLEEHFPHSMAKAVVREAEKKHLVHEELHSKVEYIVAHGISSMLEDKKVVIGSYHFVFEDEKAQIPAEKQELFDHLSAEYSHLYMAIDGRLAAVICIEDPLRPEAAEVVKELKKTGITKVVMMTGDSDRIARTIAERVGVDEYYSEVLPEDKARYVEEAKKNGHKVIMVGDGINDAPALARADIGFAMGAAGTDTAIETADVALMDDDLRKIPTFVRLSRATAQVLMQNIVLALGIKAVFLVLTFTGHATMWMAVFADMGASLLVVGNGLRLLRR